MQSFQNASTAYLLGAILLIIPGVLTDFLGIIAGGFVMTFFFATITEVWSDGQWERLWDWKSLLSLVLFVGSFFIPKVVRKLKPNV